MRGSSPSPSFLPLPVVLSAHLILKCKRVNYVIFPRRPCLFANSITNMAGASFGLSSDASSPCLSPCYSPQLPVCFEKSSRFTIKKQRESKKKGAQAEVPLYVFFMYFYLIVARFGACQGQSKGKRRTRLPSEFMALF